MHSSRKLLFLFASIFAFADLGQAQQPMTGRVVGVIDGKTFVLETASGRLHGAVEFIDVPEPEQPLSRLIREHTERLLLNKEVSFVPNGFSQRAVIGRVLLDGRDVGQQLVRDGAAWRVPNERTGQLDSESAVYKLLEDLARSEKRGIWSIEGLTPPWEFRARKDRSFSEPAFLMAATDRSAVERKNYDYLKSFSDMWVEVGGEAFGRGGQQGPIYRGYDPVRNIRNTSTSSFAQIVGDGRDILEVEIRLVHFQGTITPRSPSTAFVIGILATSTRHRFERTNSVTITADGETIELGRGQRFWRESGGSVEEMLQYRIGRIDLGRLEQAKKVAIKLGTYSGEAGPQFRAAIGELLSAASP